MATNATNAVLTINMITAKFLVILHQKCNFIGSINREYDDSFANSGAKIGNTLRIRLPVRYLVNNGANLVMQNTVEQNTSLTISTQKHVAFSFSTADLTMSIDDFSARYIEPAAAVLAASMESDAIQQCFAATYNETIVTGPQVFKNVLQARKILLDNLTPQSKQWQLRINTQDNVDMVDVLKGLFQQSTQIARQYTDGVMGLSGGFEWAENTHLSQFTTGARSTAYVLNGVPASGATTAVVATGTGNMVVGDIFTIAGVFRVHPETKLPTATLQQFVVTTAYAGGAGTINFAPALVYDTTSGYQNVSAAPATNAALTFDNALSTSHGMSLAYHPDAYTFGTADLVMPQGVDMAARAVKDGLSVRIVRQYDINNDYLPCRVDVLYGVAAIRPQLACRVTAN
jgi:hypothetical protein